MDTGNIIALVGTIISVFGAGFVAYMGYKQSRRATDKTFEVAKEANELSERSQAVEELQIVLRAYETLPHRVASLEEETHTLRRKVSQLEGEVTHERHIREVLVEYVHRLLRFARRHTTVEPPAPDREIAPYL